MEFIAAFILLVILLVKSETFLGPANKEKHPVFTDIGFKSRLFGFGVFNLLVCSIQDGAASDTLLKYINKANINVTFISHPIYWIYAARYVTFATGTFCILFTFIKRKWQSQKSNNKKSSPESILHFTSWLSIKHKWTKSRYIEAFSQNPLQKIVSMSAC